MKLYKIEKFSQKLENIVQNFKSISWKTLILSYVSLHGRRRNKLKVLVQQISS
jgi:hypothetical protein